MTPMTVRLIQNLRLALHTMTQENLYHLVLALRHELARRGLDCTPEADALVCALLAHARTEHAAIFSADCSDGHPPVLTRDGRCARCLEVREPATEAS